MVLRCCLLLISFADSEQLGVRCVRRHGRLGLCRYVHTLHYNVTLPLYKSTVIAQHHYTASAPVLALAVLGGI
jgi:hypothetical protein